MRLDPLLEGGQDEVGMNGEGHGGGGGGGGSDS